MLIAVKMAAAAQLESVLARLLVPDSKTIQEATQEIREYVKDPAVVPALCTVITTSKNVQVRQYAAVLLRRRIMKGSQWKVLPPDTVNNIRENILQVLIQEQEGIVRKSLAELVGTIAKHDLADGKWPQLFQFIEQYTSSQDIQHREVGIYVLSTVSKVAPEALQPHLTAMLNLCSASLDERQSPEIPLHAIQVLKSLIGLIGSDTVKNFQPLIPKIMTVIKVYIDVNEEKACDAMEILDELIECEVGLIVPYISSIVQVCLEIAMDKSKGDNIRIKCLSFISWLTRLKKKALIRLKLVESIINVAFGIMCEDIDNDDLDDMEAEANTAPQFASQVIDVLALHLPPEKFIPQLMQHVEPGLQNENPNVRRAAFTAIAVSCEGCADHIRSKYLKVLLECVYRGVGDESVQVRNAALFAIGHFSEHLQPHISKYSRELLPLLFNYMSEAEAAGDKDPKGLINSYYALEMFCENLGKDIIPYLPTLMEHLIKTIQSNASIRAKELAISAIGATANAARDDMLPYFGETITQLKNFLTPQKTDDDQENKLKLQVQAIDTLGVLARTVGEENFRPLAQECVQLGVNLLAETTDPDLRRCIFGLFAAVSSLLKTEMAPYLDGMVKQMIESLNSTDGITTTLPTEEYDMFKMFDEENIEDEDDDDDSESPQELELENAYIDEKEDACHSLGELAVNTGVAFLPYLEQSYKEVSSMIDYIAPGVRVAAVTAMGQFCTAIAKIAKENQSQETYAATQNLLKRTIPDLMRIAREDTERQVAMCALEVLHDTYKKTDGPMLLNSVPELVVQTLTCVKDVFLKRMACQEDDTESDVELDDQEAEFDSMLIENAGDVIPAVASVVGGENFVPYFQGFLPDLLKKLKPGSTTAEKSFAIGSIAETLHAMEDATSVFAGNIYPHFVNMTQDEDEEVRSNSVFGIGVLARYGGAAMHAKYPEMLKILFSIVSEEKDQRVKDNVVAAVCRMVGGHVEGVPLDQVIPVIVQSLPLKEDLEENATVYKCLAQLYAADNPIVLQHLQSIVKIIAEVLGEKELEPEVKTVLSEFVQNINQRYPEQIQNAINTISPEHVARLQKCCTVVNGS